jgi:hypothetical protein
MPPPPGLNPACSALMHADMSKNLKNEVTKAGKNIEDQVLSSRPMSPSA